MDAEAAPADLEAMATQSTNAELITAAWDEAWAAYYATGKTLKDAWNEEIVFPDDTQDQGGAVETAAGNTDAEATSEDASYGNTSDSDSESVIDLTGGTVDDAYLDSDDDFEVLFPGYDPELHDAWWNAEREVMETVAGIVTEPDVLPTTIASTKDDAVVPTAQEPQPRDSTAGPATMQADVTPLHPNVIRHSETISGTRKLAEGFRSFVAQNTHSMPQVSKVPISTVTPVAPASREASVASTAPVAPPMAIKGQVPPPFVFKEEKPAKRSASQKQQTKASQYVPDIQQTEASSLRKLVTIRRISSIREVRGSSQLLVATIDGWEVVIHRNDRFKVGQTVVFFEIDSFLPATDLLFAQLPNQTTFNDVPGHHVVTSMHLKQISQGLIFPVENFPEIEEDKDVWAAELDATSGAVIRTDYSAMLGVVKYCVEGSRAELAIGRWPAWIQKADMERIQNITDVFRHTKYGNPKMQFQETTKMDGSTMTCYFIRDDSQIYKSLPDIPRDPSCPSFCANGRFGVCSRTADLKYRPDSIYWQAALHYRLHEKLSDLNKNVAVQGELVGSSIESNFHDYAEGEHEFFLFTVYDIDSHERMDPKEVVEFAKEHDLKHVPVKGYFLLPKLGRGVEDLVARAGGQEFEGLVYKNVFDGRWFKVISPDWLLRKQVHVQTNKKGKGKADGR